MVPHGRIICEERGSTIIIQQFFISIRPFSYSILLARENFLLSVLARLFARPWVRLAGRVVFTGTSDTERVSSMVPVQRAMENGLSTTHHQENSATFVICDYYRKYGMFPVRGTSSIE
ncbi:hypothetical protein CBL_08562 [Carabus blaptoides fortunei]